MYSSVIFLTSKSFIISEPGSIFSARLIAHIRFSNVISLTVGIFSISSFTPPTGLIKTHLLANALSTTTLPNGSRHLNGRMTISTSLRNCARLTLPRCCISASFARDCNTAASLLSRYSPAESAEGVTTFSQLNNYIAKVSNPFSFVWRPINPSRLTCPSLLCVKCGETGLYI